MMAEVVEAAAIDTKQQQLTTAHCFAGGGGDARQERRLSQMIKNLANDPLVTAEVPEESMSLIGSVNSQLLAAGLCPLPPNWTQIIDSAKAEQAEREARWREDHQRLACILGTSPEEISGEVLEHLLLLPMDNEEAIRQESTTPTKPNGYSGGLKELC